MYPPAVRPVPRAREGNRVIIAFCRLEQFHARATEKPLHVQRAASQIFRTKSDSRTAFNCANPAQCRFALGALNALVGARFR